MATIPSSETILADGGGGSCHAALVRANTRLTLVNTTDADSQFDWLNDSLKAGSLGEYIVYRHPCTNLLQGQEGTWRWVTGPEAGTIFWLGAVGGFPQNGLYTFWNTGEPNNLGGEHYAHITDPSIGILGSWNDLPNTGSTDPNSEYHPQGYIIEYGGMPGEPTINLSASTRIETPKSTITEGVSCDAAIVELSVDTNVDTILWFDSETATTPIHTGAIYNASVTETTTFWVLTAFAGCTGGARTPITATVYGLPETEDITIVQ